MKRRLALALILALSVTACGKEEEVTEVREERVREEKPAEAEKPAEEN